MPRTVIYDQLEIGSINITVIDGVPALSARYRVRASATSAAYDGIFVPASLTAQQQSQLSALYIAITNAIKNQEGV